MATAEHIEAVSAFPAGGGSAAAPVVRPRRRLFLKYALLFVTLVGAALLVTSGFDFWFSYQESKTALTRIQQEKADAASQRIAEFVGEIERQIGWTTHAQWAAAPLDQRRQDYVRLLHQVPAITEVAELDGQGKEQLRVSRLAMDVIGGGTDFSTAPVFTEAKAHGTWFSPVYFRKQSEPYMTLAIARAGRNAGVTVAEINLKLIWDVITALKIGQGGYAYVVDGHGKLIAHPDISLVLRDTDLSRHPQVAAALNNAAAATSGEPTVTTAANLAGHSVLVAHSPIAPLGWLVFVEVPLREAFAPLYGAALRTALLLVFGLIAATFVALLLARRMTGPIHAIAAGAERLGQGELDRRIELRTGDELEGLANQFNRMAADLQRSYAELEHKVEERTAELSKSLEYQTATSDLLKLISRSTFDLQPVLSTLVETAVRLCGADAGHLALPEGDDFRTAAAYSMAPEMEALVRQVSYGPGRGTAIGRALLERRVVQIDDIGVDPEHAVHQAATQGLIRTILAVPLLREGEPIGALGLSRSRVEPFAERQVELVRTFADQAVIAIENTRLITETREALEQQTATAEVLGIISSSPGQLEPVFDAMLSNAVRICSGSFGILALQDDGGFRGVAVHGVGTEFREALTRLHNPPPGTGLYRLQQTAQTVQIADCAVEPAYDRVRAVNPAFSQVRTALHVPMLREKELLGAILIFRDQVIPFDSNQIALVESFAAQAVIAIENTRLITETREALEQQTATAEVLQVINASPGELAPVFAAMLEKALRLCEAGFGILFTYDGESFRSMAQLGMSAALADYLRELTIQPRPSSKGSHFQRLIRGEAVLYQPDVRDTDAYREGLKLATALVDLDGARTALWVALRKEERLLGAFVIYRREVRPFTDKQIALLQSFAAQAVIAMDNARLLGEIRKRQAELRVTFDNMGDGVAMFDANLQLAAWNRNFQELLELPDAFLSDSLTYEDYLRYLAGRGEFGTEDIEGELGRRLENTDREFRAERIRPDGHVLEVRRNAVPGGGCVLIYSDITERKRAEEEIRAARDAAEKALGELQVAQASLIHAEKMASLGQLTAGIAHEIKNPLNFVNNFAGLSIELLNELKEAAAPAIDALGKDKRAEIDETIEMLTSNLDKIGEHGRRADGIVKSMLAHSRGTSGERQPTDLNGLVEEALNLAYHGARAQDQNFNITLERDFAASLPPVELVPQDVTRVFLNLIGNGFHAAHKRQKEAGEAGFRPVLKVVTRDLGDTVEVRVRDNGTGIRPEHRDKLFQPFFTTKPTGEGTGLGLSISYDIVTQQHGGTIEVDSELGEFTEFTVRLPRARQISATERAA